MMNNPMQFIDVAHEKNVLLDMYSDKLSVLESNLFDDSKDPANLQRLILKHLVKVGVISSQFLELKYTKTSSMFVESLSLTLRNWTQRNWVLILFFE